jgi:hypothetical protein
MFCGLRRRSLHLKWGLRVPGPNTSGTLGTPGRRLKTSPTASGCPSLPPALPAPVVTYTIRWRVPLLAPLIRTRADWSQPPPRSSSSTDSMCRRHLAQWAPQRPSDTLATRSGPSSLYADSHEPYAPSPDPARYVSSYVRPGVAQEALTSSSQGGVGPKRSRKECNITISNGDCDLKRPSA